MGEGNAIPLWDGPSLDEIVAKVPKLQNMLHNAEGSISQQVKNAAEYAMQIAKRVDEYGTRLQEAMQKEDVQVRPGEYNRKNGRVLAGIAAMTFIQHHIHTTLEEYAAHAPSQKK